MTELPELLGKLEDEWGRRGVPVGLLRPGVSRDEVESKIKALPFDLDPPEELYEWYAWHDGADRDDTGAGDGGVFDGRMLLLPTHLPLSPLDDACEGMRTINEMFPASQRFPDQGNQEFEAWSQSNHDLDHVESHFNFLQDEDEHYAAVACTGGTTGRVYALDTSDLSEAPPLESIADLIRGLLKVYELGEVTKSNFMNMDDDPSKHSGVETMSSSLVEKRDPLISNFY